MAKAHVHAFVCGRHTVPKDFMLEGAEGAITIPIVGFVVTHPRGVLVFDSGFSPRVHEDLRAYFPADALATRAFHFSREEELPRRMREAGLNPNSVTVVTNSHLHYDHCGGNVLFPDATLLVQRAEWEAATAAPPEQTGYRQADLDTDLGTEVIDGEHDVFDDGSVVLFPTPGHTAGHQSLRVECPRGTAVLAGDACYMAETLERGTLPGGVTPSNRDQFLRSLAGLRALADDGAVVFPSHDPGFWAAQPLAPAPLLG